MRTPERNRTLFNIGFTLVLLAAVVIAMTAPGCASAGGATGTDSTGVRGPGFDPLKFGLTYLKDAAKDLRVTFTVTKDGDKLCAEFGFADAAGRVYLGTSGAALLSFDAPCFDLSTLDEAAAVQKGYRRSALPRVSMTLPVVLVDTSQADTTGKGE